MSTTNAKHLGNDLELVSEAKRGDEDAFAALYERHAPIAWRMGLAITGTPEAAAATTAESFGRTFTSLRAGRDAGVSFRPQLLTTVRNTAIDNRRQRGAGSADAFAYAGAEGAAIASAFAPLPERWRSTLWLHEVEGLRFKHIGPVVGLTATATVALAERARNGLIEQYLSTHLAGSANRTCGRSIARMGSYVAGTLPASDVDKLERHLRLCPECADRHGQLADVGRRLRLLILPLPGSVAEESRAAWTAAVAAASARTGTGLSAATEKVLAGVSAVAAAVGVFGAAMLNGGNGNGSGGSQAAAASPAAETSEATEPVEQPETDVTPDITPVELPTPDNTGTNRVGSVDRTSNGRNGTVSTQNVDRAPASTPADSEDTDVIGASDPGSGVTPAGDITPAAPRTDGQGTTDPGTIDPGTDAPAPAGGEPSAPAVKVGTNVGDVPVGVEVGDEVGITVGPISVGSEPTVDKDDPLVSLDGPLAPLAPVVDPVIAPVDETVNDLTSALGL